MANEEHLKIIRQGVADWNAWREANRGVVMPDLSRAPLIKANLSGAKLIGANLSGTHLTGANLSGANLIEANLSGAHLSGANLSGAFLIEAHLSLANLGNANLSEADLVGLNLSGANLSEADLSRASVGWTMFANTDLSTVKGLQTVTHVGPSTIGVDTLFRSQGCIPEAFLRGSGVPEEFITQIPALIASVKPIQFQSCFISYSHRDEEFAKRLHAAMRSENLRVWFAPEEMKGGKKLHEQIFEAIQIHDRLLLVLSADSMRSEWVVTEIKRAKKVERQENRRKLFPIRLVDFNAIQRWECFDTESKRDLADEVREFYIPDFSNWKEHDAFEAEFAKLLRDLKATKT